MANRDSVKRLKSPLAVPFVGGMKASVEKVQVPPGGYSEIYNMRPKHPGMVKRAGQAKLHATADGTNEGVTGFQYSLGKQSQRHTFAQMGDGDVLTASNALPTVGAGVFGTEVFSGSANDIPASWGVLNDLLLYSNGADQHQIWSGNTTPVWRFIVFKGAAAIPIIPDGGADYSTEVGDGVSTTVAVLDSLGDFTNDYDAVFIGTPVPADTLTWTVSAANTTAGLAELYYWNGAWTDTSMTDNTLTGGNTTLGQSGTMTWTAQTDEVPHYMFGECMFWYRYNLADAATSLDAEVEVSAVTFESNWQGIHNVWDGVPVDIIEAQFDDNSAGIFKTMAASTIELDSMTTSDKLYFSSLDQICGVYIDVGEKPNTTAATTINAVNRWDGAAWQAVSTLDDGTDGLSKSGWVTWARVDSEPRVFQDTLYQSYWYYFTVGVATVSSDVIISMQTMPYFDINEYGRVGNCNGVWKDRALYTFKKSPHEIYVSATKRPMVINGEDYTILLPGDGRANAVKHMGKFYNELLVYQEEKGNDGGCITLFEGTDPGSLSKLVLSAKIGTLNSKSVVVVDGVLTSTGTEEKPKTLAYNLSHYGIFKCDGISVDAISDDVQHHFDPTDSTNCIRRGYEDKMWIAHDTAYNVLRVGLVTGTSATKANTFLVYDLIGKGWSYDNLAQPLSFVSEGEAASGDIPIIQFGGGTADGFIYRLNTGSNDVSTAIDAYARMELTYNALIFYIDSMIVRCKVQSTGELNITPYLNNVAQTAISIPMQAKNTGDATMRERFKTGLIGDHISLKFQNNSASQSLYLEDLLINFGVHEER